MFYKTRLKKIEDCTKKRIDKVIIFTTDEEGTYSNRDEKIYTDEEFNARLIELRNDPEVNWNIIRIIEE